MVKCFTLIRKVYIYGQTRRCTRKQNGSPPSKKAYHLHVIAHDAHGFRNTVEIKITSCSEGTDQVFTLHGVRGIYQHQDKEHAQGKCDDDGDVSLRAADGVVDREERRRTGSSGTA